MKSPSLLLAIICLLVLSLLGCGLALMEKSVHAQGTPAISGFTAAQDLKAGQCAAFLGGTNGITNIVIPCSNNTGITAQPVYPCVGVITADTPKGQPVPIAGPGEVITIPNLPGVFGLPSAGWFVGDIDGTGRVVPMGRQLSGITGAVSFCGYGLFNEPTLVSRTAMQILVEPGYVGLSN